LFTGLIREIGKVVSFQNSKLTVSAEYSPKIGDSIAVNGACLTVVSLGEGVFSVELSPETESVVAMENYRDSVHIEPAMKMGDRFEGHVVQGHIDILGSVEKIEKSSNSYDLYISIPEEKIDLMIPKGSVSVDGVSLTINETLPSSIRLTIIPHTMENTIFKNYKVGTRVNIESDMFARYVERIISRKREDKKLSWDGVDSILARY
jgi:riboflavin synthase